MTPAERERMHFIREMWYLLATVIFTVGVWLLPPGIRYVGLVLCLVSVLGVCLHAIRAFIAWRQQP